MSALSTVQLGVIITLTVVYPESWHIQNQKHIHNPGIFTTLVRSETHYIQNVGMFKIWGIFIYNEALIIFTFIIIFPNYNYCGVEILR